MFEELPAKPKWVRESRAAAPSGGPDLTGAAVSSDAEAVRVAGWVDAAIGRADGMLFTATPTQDLDELIVWQQLANQVFAGMLRRLTAASNRATSAERFWVGDEVGLAIGASASTGSALVLLADQACELPGLLEAVEDNLLTERHVRTVLPILHEVQLSLEQRQAVVLVMLARFTGQTPHQLGELVRRLILTVDLEAAKRRQDLADLRRGVRVWDDVDGQACLQLKGPKPDIAKALAQLRTDLAALPADPTDERSTDAKLFDLAIALLTGKQSASGGWEAHIVVPFSTAAGGGLELAEIPGLGPVLPSTARDLAEQASSLRRIAVDPHGQVIAVDDSIPGPGRPAGKDRTAAQTEAGKAQPAGTSAKDVLDQALRVMATDPVISRDLRSSSHRVPKRIHRFLEARDRSCVFPTCHRPASMTDKDHRLPWPLGPTDAHNLQCLCRRHHRAKQATFTVRKLNTGVYRWTTRTGHRYDRPPQGY